MKKNVPYTLLAVGCSLLGACAKNPVYPPPPASVSPLHTYHPAPAVHPIVPEVRTVPQLPEGTAGVGLQVGSDRIVAQDLLEVTVFKVPDLTRTIRVDSQGNMTYPLIGSLRAAGLKPAQVEQEIARRLAATYMNDPQVTVVVKESVQNRVTVEGAVTRPGVFPVAGRTTFLQALALAGGLSEKADKRYAVLLRRDGYGQITQQPIDIEAIRQGRLQDLPLLQDDRIVVQEVSVTNRFTVTGAVNTPGLYPLQEGMTFLQAVASAGGATRMADQKRAVLFRRMPDGVMRRYSVNLQAIYEGRSADPQLAPDDRIVMLDSKTRALLEDASRVVTVSPITLF